MTTAKLIKRLQREVKANPQKALILGLLLVVALYFWAPLLKSWTGSGETPVAAAPQAPADVAGQPAAGTAAPAEQVPWQKLVQWIDSEDRTKPASWAPGARDPFKRSERGRAARAWPAAQLDKLVQGIGDGVRALDGLGATRDEQETIVGLPEVSPEEAGLALTSTIVGAQRRVALIGGKAYLEGKTIAGSGGGDQVEFVLRSVRAKSVVLERNGKTYELMLPVTELAGGSQWDLRGE